MCGTNDGVIDQSRFRYDTPVGAEWHPVQRTFHEAFTSNRGDCVLAMIDGATHFSFADPDDDPSAGRPFLDYEAQTPGPAVREFAAELIGAFLDLNVRSLAGAKARLDELLSHPLVAEVARR